MEGNRPPVSPIDAGRSRFGAEIAAARMAGTLPELQRNYLAGLGRVFTDANGVYRAILTSRETTTSSNPTKQAELNLRKKNAEAVIQGKTAKVVEGFKMGAALSAEGSLPSPNEDTRKVMAALAATNLTDEQIVFLTAKIMPKYLMKAPMTFLAGTDERSDFEDDFDRLVQVDVGTALKLKEAVLSIAQKDGSFAGLTADIIRDRLNEGESIKRLEEETKAALEYERLMKEDSSRKLERPRGYDRAQRSDVTIDFSLISLFEEENTPQSKKAARLYQAVVGIDAEMRQAQPMDAAGRNINPEIFNVPTPELLRREYERRIQHNLNNQYELDEDGNPDHHNPNADYSPGNPEEAAKKATTGMHRDLVYMVNKIFAPVLDQEVENRFDEVAQNAGNFYDNARIRFNRLRNALIELKQARPPDMGDLQFYNIGQEQVEYLNPDTHQVETVTTPKADLVKAAFPAFTEQMQLIVDGEKNSLEFGFDVRILVEHGAHGKDATFFSSLAGFAGRSLKTGDIDRIYALPGNELITAAKMGFETNYEYFFAQNMDWARSPQSIRELLQHLNKAEERVLHQMLHNFGKADGSNHWEVRRAFYHARMEATGMQVFLNELASRSDPDVKDDGSPTYLTNPMDALAGFSPFQIAEQWRVDDLTLKRMLFLPYNRIMENFQHMSLGKKGEKLFHKSYKYGRMAYFDDKDFDDKELGSTYAILAQENPTKSGGVDVQGGWRVFYGYVAWLDKDYDRYSRRLKFEGDRTPTDNPKILVNSWKKLENIGINVIKNFQEEAFFNTGYLYETVDEDKGTKRLRTDRLVPYEEFSRFLYRRYFAAGPTPDDSKLGYSFYNAPDENAFWAQIDNQIRDTVGKADGYDDPAAVEKIFKKMIYNAMTVMLYERTPTRMLSVEKRRNSQNGITMLYEIESDRQLHNNPKALEEFNDIVFDLMYVQQQARHDSVEQMEKIRKLTKKREGQPGYDPVFNEGNLYGDLDSDISRIDLSQDVNLTADNVTNGQGTGYVINEAVIRRFITQKYSHGHAEHGNGHEPTIEERVQAVIQLHKDIRTKLLAKPTDNEEQQEWAANPGKMSEIDTSKTKYQRSRDVMKNRLNWFSDAWHDWDFGTTFYSDTAGMFIRRIETGENTPQRMANRNKNVAEPLVTAYIKLNKVLKKVSKEKKYDDLGALLSEVKDAIKEEDEDLAYHMIYDLAMRMIYFYRRDDGASSVPAQIADYAALRKSSFSQELAPDRQGFNRWAWDKDEIYKFTSFLLDNTLAKVSGKEGKKYKYTPLQRGIGDRAMAAIGRGIGHGVDANNPDINVIDRSRKSISDRLVNMFGRPLTKRERDYLSEKTVDGMRGQNKASWGEILNQNLPYYFLIALAAILFVGTAEGAKELKTT